MQFDRNNAINIIKTKAQIQLEYQKDNMLVYFENVKSDLLFLPQLNEFLNYREMKNLKDKLLLDKEFLEFIKSKKEYDQIRYIDENGDEIARINNNKGSPLIVTKENLQNKKDRDYYFETMSLDTGEIYVSKFDLNREFNKVELPVKPMIRFATPLHNSQGDKKGILVINYLGTNLLYSLKEATLKEPGIFSLVNLEGYWLFNDNPEEEWGFMFPEKNITTLSESEPEIWEQIITSDSSQFVVDNRLVTAQIIVPFPASLDMIKEQWILLNTIPFEEIGISWSQIFYRFRYAGFLIVLVDLVLALLLTTILHQRNKLRSEMRASALYDSLTGLANRRLLFERIQATITQYDRYKYLFALIYIDLDGFKQVNDTLGHNAGDQLLKAVSSRLIDCVRSSDTVARIGGDEFVILISHIESSKDCTVIADKILKELNKAYNLEQGEAKVRGSLGIVIKDPDKNETIDELLKKADSAMYDVKEAGKNNYKIYSE
jgi:diguanylate cyclase (GGDEF)-like protein